MNLFGPQAAKHLPYTLTRAATFKTRLQGLETAQSLLPEEPAQNRFHVQRQELFALDRCGKLGDAVVVFIQPNLEFTITQITLAFGRHALYQQACGELIIGRQDQRGIQLLRLQHVVRQNIAQIFKRFSLIPMQRHHTLIGRLPRCSIRGIQRDGTAALPAHVGQAGQVCLLRHLAHHLGRDPK